MRRIYKTCFLLLLGGTCVLSCQFLASKDADLQGKDNCGSVLELLANGQAGMDEIVKAAPDLYLYRFKAGNIFMKRWTCSGFYHFTLWNQALLLHDSIPVAEYVSDSIGLINRDLMADLLIKGRHMVGNTQVGYVKLYCNDGNTKFISIPTASAIPNPRVSFNGVSGWSETDSGSLEFNYEWKERFVLEIKDTVKSNRNP